MASMSPRQSSFDLANSPMSPLSSPSSPSFTDVFVNSLPSGHRSTSIYDVLHASDNPPEFYSDHPVTLQTAGCQHLADYKKQLRSNRDNELMDDDDRLGVFANYRSLIRYSLAWHKSRQELGEAKQTKKRKHAKDLPLPHCMTCSDALSRVHVCLDCVYMGCWKKGHMRDHLNEKKHTFAMDFGHRTLYCNACGDYVYDAEFNDLILRHEVLRSESKSRRKKSRIACESWEPTSQDISVILKDSTLVSCQGIRGLCNMGNTCFMNVILQSFIHNPLLKAHFLSDQHNPARCRTKFCLCCEMNNLFSQIYSGQKEPYGPCSFLQSMWMSLKELAGYAQQDAHEFFISALNNIHAGSEGHSMVNCNCIVHKTFAGVLQSNVTCQKCGNVTTTFDPMLDISLDLRPVERKKKNGSVHPSTQKPTGSTIKTEPNKTSDTTSSNTSPVNGPMRRSKQVNSLTDCLDRYTHPEKLGTNEYSCSKCGNTFQEATKQLSVKRLPPVLSFQLKRFEHGASATKIETKIKFPVELDMTPYTSHGKREGKSSSENVYTLFAVVNHQGRMDTGHYTMYSKHRGEWFKFDDHNVTMTYQKDVLESKAYMCFYIKKTLEYSNERSDDDIFGFV